MIQSLSVLQEHSLKLPITEQGLSMGQGENLG